MTRYHVDTNVRTGRTTVTPYTAEEEAAADAADAAAASPENNPLTARQLRLGLVRNGVSLAAVQAAIDALPTASARDEAQIYWEFSTEIHWSHPMTQTLVALVGIPVESARAMWLVAKDYER